MTTKVSVVNEHSTSFMGGISDMPPKKYDTQKRNSDGFSRRVCHSDYI